MSAIRDKFLARVYSGVSKEFDLEVVAETSERLKSAMFEGYGSNFSDVDVDSKDFEMLNNLERNVYQFSAAKNYQELQQLTQLLTDESGQLRPFNDFRAEAEKVFKTFNEDYLSTEYGTAVNSAMQASRWVDYTKNAKAMPYLRYVTAGDSRVRDSHKSLDGVVKRIDDTFWDTYYPPNGYNCRCTTTQTGQSKETAESAITYPRVSPMFKTNLAKTGLIFPKDHPYYEGTPDKVVRQSLAYLPPENTFRAVKVDSDSYVDIHPLHGQKELAKNIDASTVILKHLPNAKIKLNPIINESDYDKLAPKFYKNNSRPGKNPDVTIDGVLHEIEVSSKGTKTSIHNAIRHGNKQCERIVIRIPDDADMNLMYQYAKGQIGWHDNIEEVWIINNSEWLTIDGKGVIKQKRTLPK